MKQSSIAKNTAMGKSKKIKAREGILGVGAGLALKGAPRPFVGGFFPLNPGLS
jgi:hypothetical protein